MFKKIVFIALIMATAKSYAEPPNLNGWTLISGDPTIYNYMKNGSFKASSSNYSSLVQMVYPDSSSTEYYKMEVSRDDCKSGYGEIRYRKLSGEIYRRFDFVEGAGSINSANANILCSIGKLKEQN